MGKSKRYITFLFSFLFFSFGHFVYFVLQEAKRYKLEQDLMKIRVEKEVAVRMALEETDKTSKLELFELKRRMLDLFSDNYEYATIFSSLLFSPLLSSSPLLLFLFSSSPLLLSSLLSSLLLSSLLSLLASVLIRH